MYPTEAACCTGGRDRSCNSPTPSTRAGRGSVAVCAPDVTNFCSTISTPPARRPDRGEHAFPQPDGALATRCTSSRQPCRCSAPSSQSSAARGSSTTRHFSRLWQEPGRHRRSGAGPRSPRRGARTIGQGRGALDSSELLRLKAELVLLQDLPSAATIAADHFQQSLEWARRQEALAWELRSATSLARTTYTLPYTSGAEIVPLER
jgi:hypothetical protein